MLSKLRKYEGLPHQNHAEGQPAETRLHVPPPPCACITGCANRSKRVEKSVNFKVKAGQASFHLSINNH